MFENYSDIWMTPWPDVVSFTFRRKYSTLSAKMEDVSSDLKM